MSPAFEQPATGGSSFPGSSKTYLAGSRPDLRVPMRRISS